jgi:transposase InsO family protein
MFIQEQSRTTNVRGLCRVLGVSPSAYYRWRQYPASTHRQDDALLIKRIQSIYTARKCVYGSPRIHDALREQGIRCGRKRVARLMREHHLRAKTVLRFRVTTKPARTHRPCQDLVGRNFQTAEPNRIWTSDITYLWTRQGWAYLAVVLDLHSRRVVGWELAARLTTDLVTSAILRAIDARPIAEGLVFHSDRGSQYTSQELQRLAREHGLRQSHGFSCFDNAVTESFFHTLKTEHIRFESFETREQARFSLFEYIEVFYNRLRKHSSLGMMSPVQFEEQDKST